METLNKENIHSPSTNVDESQDAKTSDSAENFQKFMYELFEKNGVINDLRAYLRGHIIGVIRSAQTGDLLTCQKNFTQRLELPFQALNMLIAEYLLRQEFNYSLSIFISEIPLANMVFGFARNLMMNIKSDGPLRFKDEDVWSILNYLGVRCDSEHASSIVKMYGDGKSPLLLCLLKTMALYKELPVNEQDFPADESLSSGKSSESLVEKQAPSDANKCKHYAFCKNCQNKVLKIKEKYNKKKIYLVQNIKESSIKNVESLLRNIDVIERGLIDEMFQQLKSVYESEMEMMKNDEEKRVKRFAASHAAQLQKKRAEMEQSFRSREAELVKSVQAKKRFLWGLARDLRDQHRRLARGMMDVREEAARLAAREDSLKAQLAKAEEVIRQRGEDMRQQISNELTSLEEHLDCMKKERDNINKERSELEHVRHLCTNTTKTTNVLNNSEDLYSHYDLIKSEFLILKKYLETAKLEQKCVTEMSTITEMADVTSKIDIILNNGQDVERYNSDLKTKRVVNDLKKPKNVNFSQSNLDEIYRERSRSSRSHSSVSSEAGDAQLDEPSSLRRLREENERLRTFARQQREHIDELSSQQARLQAELTLSRAPPAPGPFIGPAPAPAPAAGPAPVPRPRTAPAPDAVYNMQRLNSSASTNNLCHGWRKGAGEELSLFADARPTIVLPGDTLPFVGRVDRQADCRRYLINQWRSMRRRTSPERTAPAPAAARRGDGANSAGPSVQIPINPNVGSGNRTAAEVLQTTRESPRQRPKSASDKTKSRDRSKETTRESKEKFKSKEAGGSPGAVLRDAKLRLRRLELEAEAVERSYRDYRARRGGGGKLADTSNPKPPSNLDEAHAIQSTSQGDQPKPTTDFGKYIQEYRTKYDLGETIFKNKNSTSIKVKPVPAALSSLEPEKEKNYLETPLTEFRKYYQSEKRAEVKIQDRVTPTPEKDISDGVHSRTPTFINVTALDYRNTQSLAKKRDDLRNDGPKSKIPVPLGKVDAKAGYNREYIEIVERTEMQNFPDIESESPSNINYNGAPTKPDNSRFSLSDRDVESIGSTGTPNALNPCKFKGNKRNSQEESGLSDRSLTHTDMNQFENSKAHKTTPGHIDGKRLPKSPKAKHAESSTHDSDIQARLDSLRKSKQNKEFEILKKNISKIYNISEKSIDEKLYRDRIESDRCTMSERREVRDETIEEVARGESASDCEANRDDRNLLRIELDSVSEINDFKITDSRTQDVLLVVESSVEAHVLSDGEVKNDLISTQMTILVSPKRSPTRAYENERSPTGSQNRDSDEKSIQICGKDFHAIYQNDPSDSNSVHIQSDVPKENSDLEANEDPDYPDDFSADVDNFNIPLYEPDAENLSPISIPKTSETETWES